MTVKFVDSDSGEVLDTEPEARPHSEPDVPPGEPFRAPASMRLAFPVLGLALGIVIRTLGMLVALPSPLTAIGILLALVLALGLGASLVILSVVTGIGGTRGELVSGASGALTAFLLGLNL